MADEEEEIDGCKENRCENGGTCISLDGGDFKCECTPHFEGKTCKCKDNLKTSFLNLRLKITLSYVYDFVVCWNYYASVTCMIFTCFYTLDIYIHVLTQRMGKSFLSCEINIDDKDFK